MHKFFWKKSSVATTTLCH